MSDASDRFAGLSPAKRLLLQKMRREQGEGAPQGIPRRAPGGSAPLSFAQQRLWFIHRMDPGSAAYNLPYPLRLRGALDVRALERSLAALAARHETLRTVFPEHAGEPAQVVLPPAAPPVPVADLCRLDPEPREAALRRLVAEETRRPFDLARAPLLRVLLARLGEEEWGLCFTLHHVVSDGWSMGVLVREVNELYRAHSRGEPAHLPDLPVQYADYAAWQRARLTGETLEAQLRWWRDRLAGAPPLLEVPVDFPRRPVADAPSASRPLLFPPETARALRELAQREGATPFMALLAVWQVLLGRWSGQDDVTVGTPVAGRTRKELEGLIGFFVNTLVVRTEIADGATFRGVLGQVRETTLGAFAHQEVPFEKLVEELAPERSLAHTPLFQALFVLQNTERGELRLGGLGVEAVDDGGRTALFDLTLALVEGPDGIGGGIAYRADLWEASTLERMAAHFGLLLEGVLRDPDRRVGDVDLLTPAERARVLEEWNATDRPYPAGIRVHDLFAARAARTPDAVAVVHGEERLTYAELERRSARLANALRRRGVGPESRVGVCMRRTPELLVALLAVLRAGGAYVPLDPAYPRERLGYMVEDARVSLVLTEPGLADRLPESGAGVVFPDAASGESNVVAESGVLPENLSHVIFTSGSTGRPKGVMIRHSSTVVLLHWLRENVSDEERASVLFSTSINFDVSVAEVFGTLCWGGKLVLVENALELASVEEPVAYVSMVPSAAAALLRMGGIPASVRTLNLGGEALPNALAQGLYGLSTVEKVGNLYGPTEDTTYSTYSRVERGGAQVYVGRPVANTRAYVLDRHLQPVPVGVVGELYLAGDGLARGYASRPELTAERYLPNPFEPGARMYRVMDRVRWTAAGELEYFGRTDFQVKVRGFRIEPGEIETALEAHPGVHRAVAVVREDAPGDRRIVAYVVPAGEAVPAAELRAHLAARVPEYMLPAALVVLDALPLTPGGKLDRRALPAPRGGAEEAYMAPRTPTEARLAAIFAEVLGVERVGVHDGFFALGGHSLLAMRILARVREEWGVEVPVRGVFERPTVAALAERVDEAAGAAAPHVPRRAGSGPAPLSFAQQRLWFIHRLDPAGSAYNMPYPLRLLGPLRAEVLGRALSEVVRRHEALRTVFAVVEDGEAVQVVRPAAPVPFPVVELAGLPAEDVGAEAWRLSTEESLRPFDLTRGPLLRATLLRLAAEEHAALFTLHHVVSDAWSMDVLVREVSVLYEAFSRGEPSPLPELPVQYADFAVWQRERLSGEALEGELRYWRERLAGAPPLLEIPTDRPRPPVPGVRGAYGEVSIPPEAARALRELAAGEGATPFMALLAAWQLLLARWSGEDDVSVGTPIAGRTHAELEGLIGFFVNTLVLRTGLDGAPTFRELLRRVRETTLGAFGHQEVPFERLVEELHPERSMAHTPLFQAMFAFQAGRPPGSALRLEGLRMAPLAHGRAVAKFDLSLTLEERGEGIGGALLYRAELFEPATVERMLRHFASLAGQLAAAPDRPVAEAALLAPAERAALLEDWSIPRREPPREGVHALFAEQARRTPGAPAVVSGAETLTYAELDRRADRLARRLAGMGVGPDARVGVCVERSAELVAALLGVLGAGAAYVPLDPGYPADRLAFALADSGARVLLTQERLRDRLPADGIEVVLVDGEAAAAGDAAVADVGPDHLAYVIHTSGSTGTPKGVAVPHGALASHMRWMLRAYPLSADDRVLQKTPVGFDASVWELWAPLLAGATLVVAPPDAHRDPDALARIVESERITVLQVVPSLLAAMADGGGLARCTGLRRLFCGGEALPAELAERARAATGAEVVNLYGPTEVCIQSVTHAYAGGEPGATVPIGRPVDGVRAVVLDRAGEPVPAGVAGELYLGGAQLARGYLGRPDLTAERFVPDPFSAAPGERLYRTGDRARRLPDGALEFLGRVDQQVKVRGFRIEPGEVEAALRRHPSVRDAVVVAREERLVGYVVGPGAGTDAVELRAFLRASLPEHMVPSALVALDAFPLTPGGKLDRRALPAPEGDPGAGHAPPRTSTEAALAAIFAAVLRREEVGVHAHFFDLGGHSLLATRVVSRVREEFGVEVPLRAVFEAPTVATLAERVDEAMRAEADTRTEEEMRTETEESRPADERGGLDGLSPERRLLLQRRLAQRAAAQRIPRRADDGPAPLSFAQQRLWFIHQLDPVSSAYNMPRGLRLRGTLDVPALRRSVTELVRRHEAVRTSLVERDGEPVQVVLPPAPLPAPVVDVSALREEHRLEEAVRRVVEEGERPFDLGQGPLLHALLVRLGAEDWAIQFTMHHVVSDGWSMGVLVKEISALYRAYSRGQESPLPELPIQYADFAAWQRSWLTGEVLERQLAYWRERLAGAPPVLELPTDHPRRSALGVTEMGSPFALSPEATAAVRSAGRGEGATVFMTLLAGWQVLLGRYASQDDVVVGTPIANRTRAELEPLIGFFVNTLVLRTDLAGDPTFAELLERVRETTLGAYQHQDLPFERLVEELAPERSLMHNPLFQVMFALQNVEGGALALGEVEVEPIGGGDGGAKFDLGVTLFEVGDRIAGELTYRADLFEASTVERMAEHYRLLLEAAAADPARPVSALRLIGPHEERQLLSEWNAPRGYPTDRLVPRLFSEQAQRTPDAPAASGRGEALTYADLERRSASLARALRERGVGPEVPVGVCLERGPELLVAVLGVWKAGGAYLPLDPDYPAERLAYMLRDAAVPVLLTQERLREALPEHGAELVLLEEALTPRPPLPMLGEGGAHSSAMEPEVAPSRANEFAATTAQSPPSRTDGYDSREPVVLPSPLVGEGPGVGGPRGAPEPTHVEVSPENLAYVIYTSGSTGRPKGVRVSHGALLHTLLAAGERFGSGADDVMAAVSSFAFDIWLFESLLPLLAGGSVRVVPRERVLETERLVDDLASCTMLHAVPALMRQVALVLRASGRTLPGLRQVFVGGDAVPPDLLEEMREVFPAAALHVLYGPTEGAVICATHAVGDAQARRQWVGRPLGNATLYVLDRALLPVPVGVPGELCIGGASVARDYLGRPELNAEKFLPDPFAGEAGGRLYRTGDRVRWTAQGELEFLGRTDTQVKIRGFRIEPGEVESVLAEHPEVEEAVVVVREDAPGEKRLVGYVVAAGAGGDAPSGELQEEHVEEWESLFGDTYSGEAADEDPAFNVVGWESSYTGEPIPAEEMREWVEHAAARIRALKPRRVLEIGAGTGLLLFRVAPECEEYWAADFSAAAVRYLERQVGRREMPGVRLLERTAEDFTGIPEGHFDVVVINSVAQYFPGVDYLLRVVEGAVGALAPGGAVFLGDLRSFPLLEAFHASVERVQAPPETPAIALRERIRRRMAREKELLLHPDLFRALPQRLPRITGVEVRLKRGRHGNEMTRFRYDVTLRVEAEVPAAAPEWRRWEEGAGLDAVARELDRGPETLAYARVPNARVAGEVALLEALAAEGEDRSAEQLRALAAEREAAAVDPEALAELAEARGYRAQARWSARGGPGEMDVLLVREGVAAALVEEPVASPLPWSAYANDPLAGRRTRWLLPELRSWLGERLPEYMVPGALVLLDALPLTPNGKVDRRALPAPQTAEGEHASPRTPTEEALAGIWAEVLRLERVGIDDDFFALGGHSLLATRVVSRVREALGVEVPLRTLFEAPTVAKLGERVDALLREGSAVRLPPLRPAPRDGGPLPLSFAQQRLWFIHQLEPRSPAYNMPSPLRLRGRLDVGALERALTELVRRHESLRTVFRSVEGEPVQVVRPAEPAAIPVVELRALGDEERERTLARLAAGEAARPFDLETGPLFRAALLRPGEEDWGLLFTLHHVVSDGWSMGVLVREISALYGAFAEGRPSPLPEPRLQYADYAVWQRGWLTGEALEAQLAYWRERLAGAPPLLDLPVDHPRPLVASDRADQRAFVLSAETSRALREISHREGATLFMTLLAVYQALLGRWSGQDDVSVGTPVAGRGRLELEGLIGFFVNMLVVRTGLAGRPTFRELVGRVREGVLGAQAHQDLPFERLVDELHVERSLDRAPLFQALFALLAAAPEDERLSLGDVRVYPLHSGEATAKFDLSLTLQDGDERLVGSVVYRADLFEGATIERMLQHFRALADGVAAAPGRPVGDVDLLAPAERAQLLATECARDYPGGPVHGLFEAQVRRAPAAVALRFRGTAVTYGELGARSARLARLLRERGVGPEVPVGICLPRTPEMVAALLAVLRAGGAYLPLDPAYPQERLGWMLEDAGARLVLTDGALAGRLPAGAEAVLLDRLETAPGEVPAAEPGTEVDGENLAYVIFTSGSTGRPKGVMIRHASANVLLHWLRETVSDEERSAVLGSTSINFDVSVAEIFGTLCWGGTLHLVENALELSTLPEREEIRYASMVPTAAAELLRMGAVPAGVRTLNLGGEALPNALAQALHGLGTVEKVGNLYGPTEDTTYSTCALVPAGAERVTVGRPVANTRALVLDTELNPVPVGVVGELYLAGDGLARGYAGRPDLTAERFLPDPFGAAGARMYRVMDRVRRLGTGELEYLGRTDHQVKVRGFRVEPGEIESVLLAHPGVREAVVVVREDAPGDPRLVAYLTADGEAPSAGELRAALRRSVPEYMVPSAFVVLPELPLTPNGKTDRGALPAPERAGGGAAEHVAPRDATELALAGVWEEVLGVSPVGVRDDFFALGGHSLLAVRLMARVETVLGARLPLATLFSASTVEALAEVLRRDGAEADASPLVPIRASGGRAPLFFVHPVGGDVLCYAPLGRRLGADQPFYALRARGLTPGEPPHDTVEAMARDYLDALRAAQPHGPYRLGGWSMGGVVAFEMARLLEAEGESVETLALVDSMAPALAGRTLPDDEGVLARTFAADLGLPLDGALSAGAGAAMDAREHVRSVLEAAREAGLVPPDLGFDQVWHLYGVFRANLRAMYDYRPGPFGGKVTLLRAAEHDPAEAETLGWESVAAGGVEVRAVPGSHFTLVRDPHAAELARVVSEVLEEG